MNATATPNIRRISVDEVRAALASRSDVKLTRRATWDWIGPEACACPIGLLAAIKSFEGRSRIGLSRAVELLGLDRQYAAMFASAFDGDSEPRSFFSPAERAGFQDGRAVADALMPRTGGAA